MDIILKSAHIENFKGIKDLTINFGNKTTISGQNASGKTTVIDAVLWLLFGKNSQYVEKFDLRPLDETGKQIDFVEIMVSAILEVDGKEVELKKKQKQNWVKQRGSENSVFQGNINSYEIDGYPKSDKEYKAFIGELINEDLFKMLTAPTYFPSMKWKDQREILMKLVTAASDSELAVEFGGFEEILLELEKASTTDIQKKYQLALKELKATQNELPVRIDEVSKQVVEYDVTELESKKKELETALANVGDGAREALSKVQSELLDLDLEISRQSIELNAELTTSRRKIEDDLAGIVVEIRKHEALLSNVNSDIRVKKAKVETLSAELSGLGTKYKGKASETFDDSKWIFDESSTKCISCGQILPATKVETIKRDFETRKAKAIESFNTEKADGMKALIERGNVVKNEIVFLNKELDTLESNLSEIETAIKDYKTKSEEYSAKLSSMPEAVDLMADEKYKMNVQKKAKLEETIETLNCNIKAASEQETALKAELGEVNYKLSQVAGNETVERRIDELKKEQRDVAQKIADCEKYLLLVENFVKRKLEYISSKVNDKFKVVNFKLFDMQINGGIVDCCELTIDGVPYSDLNNGHKIVGGLDVINTLSEIYDRHVFVFVDNAESINEFNLPEMNNQIIRLCVTNEKGLTVTA